MLDRTFLLLVNVGRKTGQLHETVAMVLADERDTWEVVICSAWGPDADWVHNLEAGPAREVRIGRDRFTPDHRFLAADEAVRVGLDFRARHPRRFWLVRKVLGWGDLSSEDALREFVGDHPFVALRPSPEATG
jgi:deazaflavin-dependent oxidoreductase (nitroreductase family)